MNEASTMRMRTAAAWQLQQRDVAAGGAPSVFQRQEPGARRRAADRLRPQSRNLMLSDKAAVRHNPQASDLRRRSKCAKGGGGGPDRADELFYLEEPRLSSRRPQLLTYADRRRGHRNAFP